MLHGETSTRIALTIVGAVFVIGTACQLLLFRLHAIKPSSQKAQNSPHPRNAADTVGSIMAMPTGAETARESSPAARKEPPKAQERRRSPKSADRVQQQPSSPQAASRQTSRNTGASPTKRPACPAADRLEKAGTNRCAACEKTGRLLKEMGERAMMAASRSPARAGKQTRGPCGPSALRRRDHRIRAASARASVAPDRSMSTSRTWPLRPGTMVWWYSSSAARTAQSAADNAICRFRPRTSGTRASHSSRTRTKYKNIWAAFRSKKDSSSTAAD